MSAETPTPREVIRRLVAREAVARDAPDAAARAVHAACECAYRESSRWVGAAGCYALFTRALAQTRREHRALETVRFRAPSDHGSEPGLAGVTDSIQAHGAVATAAGLEALLVAVLEILGRLIGDDLTLTLLRPCLSNATRYDNPERTS